MRGKKSPKGANKVVAVKSLSDSVSRLAMERVASLLAERVADGVVMALMNAGFDKKFANELLRAVKEEAERAE